MLPALATWPPYTFTPRRWPWLSRPLRLLPCPFLCAMLVLLARRGVPALDAGHAHDRELLTVPLAPAIVLAAFLLEDEDLLRLFLADDLADDATAVEERLPDFDAAAGGRQQDVGKDALRARLAGELLETDRLAGLDPVLLSPRSNDGVVHRAALPRRNRNEYASLLRLSTPARRAASPPSPLTIQAWS